METTNTNTTNTNTAKTVEAFKEAAEKVWSIMGQISKDDREVIQKGLTKLQSDLTQMQKDELKAEAQAIRDEKAQAKDLEIQALVDSSNFNAWWELRKAMATKAVNSAGIMVVKISVWVSNPPTSSEGLKRQALWRAACRAKAQEIENRSKARGARVQVQLVLTKPKS